MITNTFHLDDGRGTITYGNVKYPAHVESTATRLYRTQAGERGMILTAEFWLRLEDPEPTWEDSYETP